MEKQAECREKIRGASSFLFELVNDVLDMSKMESGKIELEEVPFDLLDLLDEVVSMIEVQAMGHGLDFIYERHEEIHSSGDRKSGTFKTDPDEYCRKCSQI